MKKFLNSIFTAVTLVLVATGFSFGQTAATATWPLSSDASVTVSGNVNATSESIMGLQEAYETPPAGTTNQVQKLKPDATTSGTSGTGSWPNETGANGARYVEFSVAPQTNYDFNIDSLSMMIGDKGIKGMSATIYYSTKSDFSDSTKLAEMDSVIENAVMDTTLSALNIAVNNGDTVYIRVYPWLPATSTSTSKYFYLGNLVVYGTTSASATGPMLGTEQDFESYSVGDSLSRVSWAPADIQSAVVDDPLSSGHGKVLENVVHNYNAAPVIPFVLPAGKTLADYDSLTFDGFFQKGDVGYKYIIASAYQTKPTGHFLDTDTLGSYNRAEGAATSWEHYSIDITNSDSFSDTIYIALGINCAGTANSEITTWFADNIKLVAKSAAPPAGATLVSNWGTTPMGQNNGWTINNTSSTPDGNASMGGAASPTGWMTIKGGFDSLTTTSSQAFVITGKLEFVGGGGESNYTWFRYALINGNDTLAYKNTDSAAWSGISNGYGYIFTPVSGSGSISNTYHSWPQGNQGTEWPLINSGSWTSTNNNGGGPFTTVRQQPYQKVATAGVYDWAISVQPLSSGGNEVRWYLIQEHNQGSNNYYWWGGSFVDTAAAAPTTFNGIGFAVNSDNTASELKISDVSDSLGTPITIPSAPWQSYYVKQWGLTAQGSYWPIKNDSSTIVGNGTIKGSAPINGDGWATIQGGFGQALSVPTQADSALIVTGQLVFTGTDGGGSSYTPLRYAIAYEDSATLNNPLTDSAKWTGPSGYSGYEFDPVSGAGTMANGSGGSGTIWTVKNGSWASTWSNNGGPVARIIQAPYQAEIVPGTYNFAFSITQVNDTTNEVRWYLIEKNNKYWFGGTLQVPSTTNKFNAVCFGINTGDWTQLDVINTQVDYGKPITVPTPPWQAYYVKEWGFFGGKMGGWTLSNHDIVGNVTVSGSKPNTDWAAVRGGFSPFTVTADMPLKITGKVNFAGGGFDQSGSFRMGVFNTSSAGNLVMDTAAATLPDSSYWTGTDGNCSGYLFIPQSGNNGAIDWSGSQGTWGAVVDTTWSTPSGYALGSELPNSSSGGAGTYNFELSVSQQSSSSYLVTYKLFNDNYSWEVSSVDNHSPLATNVFNSIGFALENGNSITAMNITDVQVDTGNVVTAIADNNNNSLPNHYELSQNYPNPFNPTTTIKFALPKSGDVSLVVYDILGRVVTTLINGNLSAGYHTVNFNATNLASGVYFYRIKAGDFVSIKKLMLLK